MLILFQLESQTTIKSQIETRLSFTEEEVFKITTILVCLLEINLNAVLN